MRPVRIQARGFRSYETLDLRVPEGAAAIVGQNGAGKSSLLSMIALGLFAGKGELAAAMRDGADSVEVTVHAEHDGATYRVRRGAGKKSYLDFEVCVYEPDAVADTLTAWEPLTLASQQETQQRICETFGMDADTYKASAYLGQGRGSFASTATSPKQRMALFSSLIGLGVYERLAQKAADELRFVTADLDTLRARLADARSEAALRPTVQREVEELAVRVAEATRAHADAQARLEALREQHTAVVAQTSAVDAARAAVAAAESEHRRLNDVTLAAEDARLSLATVEARYGKLAEIAAPLPELEAHEAELAAEVSEHRRAVAEHQAGVQAWRTACAQREEYLRRSDAEVSRGEDLLAKAAHVINHVGDAECDRCGQTLGMDAATRAHVSFLVDAAQAEQEAARLSEEAENVEIPVPPEPPASDPPLAQYEQAKAAVADARLAKVELAALTERRNTLQQKIAQADDPAFLLEISKVSEALEAAQDTLDHALSHAPTPDELEQLKRDGLEARSAANLAQQTAEQARADHARAQERLARLDQIAARLAASLPEQTRLEHRVAVLTAATRAHGRTGIPSLVLENRVGAIEEAATRILSDLGGDTAGARVEIRTQRETQAGGVSDRLDVVLVTADGYDRPFDAWSGGEQMRINVALRWALAAHTGIEFVILDEPAALDADGKAALRDIIDYLLGRGVKSVLVVSHEAELRDSFDICIELVKDGGVSRVVADDREPVLA